MKKVIISVFVLFVCVAIPAQVNKDSLWSVWKDTTQVDTNRLSAIYSLAINYKNDSSLFCVDLLYDYSKTINNKRYLANSFDVYSSIFISKGEYIKAIECYQKELKIYIDIGDSNEIANSYNKIGELYKDHLIFNKALEFFQKGLIIREETKNKVQIAYSFGYLGSVFQIKGDFKNSLNHYEKGLKIVEKLNDLNLISHFTTKIGEIFCEHNDFETSLKYHRKALVINQYNNYIEGIAKVYFNIGNIYWKKNIGNSGDKNAKYIDSAFNYFDKSLILFQELGDKNGIADSYNRIGVLYSTLSEFKKAIFYFNKTLKIREEIKDIKGVLHTLNNFGRFYLAQKQYLKALVYYNKALILYKEHNIIIGKDIPLKYAVNTYKIIGDWKKAQELTEEYIIVTDSLSKMEAKDELFRYELENEYQLKKQTDSIYNIEEKKIKQLIHDAEIIEERTIRYGILGLLTLILSFSFLLYRRFRVTKKQNKIIKSQKKQVDEAFKELDIQSKKIEQKNKEVLASINYASKIQDTILPNADQIKSHFKNLFVLYHPKDIVGGDFYWYRSFGDICVVATVDCTGHGVPGGFMSMLGSLLLDKIVHENRLSTAEILKELNKEIVRVLDQKSGGVIQDGMDIALCVFDKTKNTLFFSGARNGIMVLKNDQISYFNADIFTVGGSYSKKSQLLKRDFKTHSIELNKDDWVFMYTDGYYDQLGGSDIKCMGMSLFQRNLINGVKSKMATEKYLFNEFNSWKGEYPQIDDILVLGFKI